MSKLFFDHLLNLDDLESEIRKSSSTIEEREEMWHLVDNIISPRVLEKILDKLPIEHHEGFLALFHKCPHDEIRIFTYLNNKTGKDVEKELRIELKDFSKEILSELVSPDEIHSENNLLKK